MLAAATLAALALPAGAHAVDVEVVNESHQSPEDVYITLFGGNFDVPGMENNVPKKLSEAPSPLTINTIHSGRIYVSYGAPVTEPPSFASQTRFDWVELTVTPKPGDVANLTAVDQFGIGMRLDTYGTAAEHLDELGSSNSGTIFTALQAIPGGSAATVHDGEGSIARVLSPLHTAAYPDLGEYVRSMAGKPIALHSTFSGPNPGEFFSSAYGGAFAGDGSITLTGTTDPPGKAPAQIALQGDELIEDVYTGAHTPNNMEGAIRHDVLVGFMAGYWDGRYGNDAIGFCSDPDLGAKYPFCPAGFDRPAFGAARAALSPFPTCEQYAAVINQYAEMYGNPYSDGASGKVTIPVVESGGGKAVETLRVTILSDSGDAHPVTGGDSNCGAAPAPPASPAAAPRPAARVAVHARLFKWARLRRGRLRVARVACPAACGRVRAVVRRGRRVLARARARRAGRKHLVVARLTRQGRRLMHRRRKLKARLDLWVVPTGQRAVHRRRKLLLVR